MAGTNLALMTIALLGALIVAGLVGPLLRLPKRLGIPVAVGEVLIGVIFGASGFRKIPYRDPSLQLLATVGFALLMFTVGSHINYRSITKKSFEKAFWILLANFMLAISLAVVIGHLIHFSNWKLLAVLCFSSSAALVIPLVERLLPSESVSVLITQVTLADAVAFVALPFFTQKSGHLAATLGAIVVLLASVLIYFALQLAKSRGWLNRTHEISKIDHLGLELRISLALLLLVAALAIHLHASVMIAGFALGVAIASIGVPRRLARQLFGVSEGFFAPLYFVWLGASIDIKQTFHSRDSIMLAVLLFLGVLAAHIPSMLFGQPKKFILLSSAELGIPAAAVTLGVANGVLSQGQAGAIMMAAIATIFFTL